MELAAERSQRVSFDRSADKAIEIELAPEGDRR